MGTIDVIQHIVDLVTYPEMLNRDLGCESLSVGVPETGNQKEVVELLDCSRDTVRIAHNLPLRAGDTVNLFISDRQFQARVLWTCTRGGTRHSALLFRSQFQAP